MKKRIFAALLALCLTVLTGCDWSDNTDDIFGTLTDYYNVENKDKDKDAKLTSFALPYLKGETADPITCPDGAQLTLGTLLYEGLFALDGQFEAQPALAESYTYDASRYTSLFYKDIPIPSPCGPPPSATAPASPHGTW